MRTVAAQPFDDWIAQAGVLGLWDVLKRYGYFRRKFRRMLGQIDDTKPNAVVLVDYPGFNLRLAAALLKASIPGQNSLLHQSSSLGMEPRPDPLRWHSFWT